MIKPFLLFADDVYYPTGGAFDYKGSFDSVDLAYVAFMQLGKDRGHIVEHATMHVVAEIEGDGFDDPGVTLRS